jgi:hypothetical protein
MSDQDPAFIPTLQQEIDQLREQAELLPVGRVRTRLLARATALEVAMRSHLLVGLPLDEPRTDAD